MNRTLLSLAILKVNWDKKKSDYIDNFVALLGNILYKKEYKEIIPDAINQLAADFKDEYGLVLPKYALLTICNRASKDKHHLLCRKNGVFYVNSDIVAEYDNTSTSYRIEKKFSCIVDNIQQYAKERYNIDTDKTEISDAIIAFLKHYDLGILFGAKDQAVLPKVANSLKMKYIISTFVIEIYDKDAESFQALIDLAIGNALACSILYSDPNTYSGRLTNLNIYLDTPLILALLGLSGDFKKEAFVEFLEMLKDEHANLRILETTKREIDNILSGCLKTLESEHDIDVDKASLTVRHCVTNNISASDVELKIAGLDNLLEKYEISICALPDYEANKRFQIDEKVLKQTIVDVYKTNKPDYVLSIRKEKTIERDVNALSGIYRFRQGYKPKSLRDAKNLFVTSNSALAYASRLYEKKQGDDNDVIPTCLTDVFVATIIWLQSPQKAIVQNEKKFLADCYAASQPTDKLISAYMMEVRRLKDNGDISIDDYYLLRSHRSALNMLEEKTMGDPEAITGTAIEEILERIQIDIKARESEKLEMEKNEHAKTKKDLDEERQKNTERENCLDAKAETLATWVFYILFVILSAFLAVCLCLQEAISRGWIKVLIIVVLVVVNLLSWLFGWSFWGFRPKIVLYLKQTIKKLIYT